jgi:hypothetical protein
MMPVTDRIRSFSCRQVLPHFIRELYSNPQSPIRNPKSPIARTAQASPALHRRLLPGPVEQFLTVPAIDGGRHGAQPGGADFALAAGTDAVIACLDHAEGPVDLIKLFFKRGEFEQIHLIEIVHGAAVSFLKARPDNLAVLAGRHFPLAFEIIVEQIRFGPGEIAAEAGHKFTVHDFPLLDKSPVHHRDHGADREKPLSSLRSVVHALLLVIPPGA